MKLNTIIMNEVKMKINKILFILLNLFMLIKSNEADRCQAKTYSDYLAEIAREEQKYEKELEAKRRRAEAFNNPMPAQDETQLAMDDAMYSYNKRRFHLALKKFNHLLQLPSINSELKKEIYYYLASVHYHLHQYNESKEYISNLLGENIDSSKKDKLKQFLLFIKNAEKNDFSSFARD